ncbi:DUF5696 domain-containing protein [Paenibacillus sp. CAA11]|uniref:DUF5696 domain-containing protein n=1 Tax=Paenibacillus sp. CAA11 TaxID=1532905 RepID=UPI002D76BA00|nr:DUF5696 domain-containing protein [Paenibacillus sp. CAA11]
MGKAATALVAIILIILVLAGGSDSKSANSNPATSQTASTFTKGQPLRSIFTDSRAPGMSGVVENERLQLFVDEGTGAIAVLDKQNGQFWHSNPPGRDNDKVASGVNKSNLSSQLKFDYYNSFGQVTSMNTFSDSAAHKQIRFESIPGGLRVTYQFGTAVKSAADLPMMLSLPRMEELLNKLDKSGQRALIIGYKETPDKKAFVRNDSALSGLQLERAFKAFEKAGYTQEDLRKDMEELGFTQEKPEPRIFLVSIEYVLDGDHLIVNVPVSQIEYPDDYPIGTISLLSFMGAAGPGEEGSLFVPDGSGALIHFNNGKQQYPAYQQAVYGDDLTLKMSEGTEGTKTEQAVRLPVFGMIRDHNALLGIIEKGASVATVNADVGGRLNSYNYVYPSFSLINKGQVTLKANEQERTLPRFQEQPVKTDFTVRYVFLGRDQASYQGMAKYYQSYLEQTGGLPKREATADEGEVPFYLQLVGGIKKQKQFIGIPYQTIEPLTTFKQAEEILQQMRKRDIHNIKLKFSGWFNGGITHKVPKRISVDQAVGGSKGLNGLLSFVHEQGIMIYPDLAILRANAGEGFSKNRDAARTLTGVPASIYSLDLALNRRESSKSPSYALSPRLVVPYVTSMLENLKKYQLSGISLRDLAGEINSDYRKNKQIDRSESEDASVQALKSIRKEGLQIMGDGGNGYALSSLSDITNAPMTHSQLKIEDEEIPFYQMVIRGYINYTGSPYNLSTFTGERQYILKSLEYGSGVYFNWIHEPNYKTKETEYNHLYAVNYEAWIDQAARIYHEVNDVLKKVQNQRIVKHEKLGEGVYKTSYENSVYIIVNYNNEPISIEGQTVKAESYVTGGGQS